MSRFTLFMTNSDEEITVGSTITVPGRDGSFSATVTELEPPDPEFGGCVHYRDADGKDGHCSGESLGAEWLYDGQPVRWDSSAADREAFDSGRWTDEDTASMERGRDLPIYNDAGEPMC